MIHVGFGETVPSKSIHSPTTRVVFKGFQYPQGGSDADGKYLSYEFNEAYLKDQERPVRLVFNTNDVDGVRYHFEGAFTENNGKEPN